VPRPERPPVLALVGLLAGIASAGIGCSFDLGKDPARPSEEVSADDPRPADIEEVVLNEDEDDPFGKPAGSKGTAGEMIVAIGYVGWILAAAALPFLLLGL
jgi:hypothetical protein